MVGVRAGWDGDLHRYGGATKTARRHRGFDARRGPSGQSDLRRRLARRVEPFFEKICAQPEHSPRVDSLLCPTFLDLKAMMAEEPPAKAVSGAMTRIWELCESRRDRFSGTADTSSNDGWAGQPSAGDWSSDDWASPGNQSTDEDRWYQPPPEK